MFGKQKDPEVRISGLCEYAHMFCKEKGLQKMSALESNFRKDFQDLESVMIKTTCSLSYLLSNLRSVMTALKDHTLQGLGMLRVAREPKRARKTKKKSAVEVPICISQKRGYALLCLPTNGIKLYHPQLYLALQWESKRHLLILISQTLHCAPKWNFWLILWNVSSENKNALLW